MAGCVGALEIEAKAAAAVSVCIAFAAELGGSTVGASDSPIFRQFLDARALFAVEMLHVRSLRSIRRGCAATTAPLCLVPLRAQCGRMSALCGLLRASGGRCGALY